MAIAVMTPNISANLLNKFSIFNNLISFGYCDKSDEYNNLYSSNLS